jgi:RNA polymerase sigma factor (TIGR02999 family)
MAGGVDITGLLQAWGRGDPEALDALAPVVHHELRQLARRILAGERTGRDWQPTELVNESYLRLLGWRDVAWQSRRQFYAAVARMMRRVLVDVARARGSLKRGGGAIVVPMEGVDPAAPDAGPDLVALEEALVDLAAFAPRPGQVVELRYFGGFSVEETAQVLDVSVRTVINDWNTARAWLHRRLAGSERI